MLVSVLCSTPFYFLTYKYGHRLKVCKLQFLKRFNNLVIASPVLQLLTFTLILFISPETVDDTREVSENLLNLVLILLGVSYTIKLALFPQVMPFLIK